MNKYIMLNVDDSRVGKIAEAISNKTSKKILALLADQELSESEISSKLKLPANTINYNIKKLAETGLIEKMSVLWSVKGKKVPIYKISEKKIVISPKPMLKGVLPAVIASGLIAFGIKLWTGAQYESYKAIAESSQMAASVAEAGNLAEITNGSNTFYNFLSAAPNSWAWFFIGALAALVIYVLWNWKPSD